MSTLRYYYPQTSVHWRIAFQAKLVKQEQQAIDAQYEKKTKGALTAQKMYVATTTVETISDHFRWYMFTNCQTLGLYPSLLQLSSMGPITLAHSLR
jgi:hypothetical protein